MIKIFYCIKKGAVRFEILQHPDFSVRKQLLFAVLDCNTFVVHGNGIEQRQNAEVIDVNFNIYDIICSCFYSKEIPEGVALIFFISSKRLRTDSGSFAPGITGVP